MPSTLMPHAVQIPCQPTPSYTVQDFYRSGVMHLRHPWVGCIDPAWKAICLQRMDERGLLVSSTCVATWLGTVFGTGVWEAILLQPIDELDALGSSSSLAHRLGASTCSKCRWNSEGRLLES